MPITVLGAGGWIGSALVNSLRQQGHLVHSVDRSSLHDWLVGSNIQGPVIYSIGLTSDFRERPYATVEAHVSLLSKVLQRRGLDNILLLSSTRVYSRCAETIETTPISNLTTDSSDLYNLSKLLGEALVLQDSRPGFKVVRLSNVVGPGQPTSTFLGALLKESRSNGHVTIQESPHIAKDYVALEDVVRLLPLIAIHGQERLYNLGRGRNTSHLEVSAWLERAGVPVRFAGPSTGGLSFPPLVIERLRNEFYRPGDPFRQNLMV